MSGLRYDAGKNRLDLISVPALWEIGRVYTMGSKKYEDRNWEKGMSYSRTLGCALRHTMKWAAGHRNDEESGLHHLAHAAWNLIALLHFDLESGRYGKHDDRIDHTGSVPNESCPRSDSAADSKVAALGRIKEELSNLVGEGYLDRCSVAAVMDVVEAGL